VIEQARFAMPPHPSHHIDDLVRQLIRAGPNPPAPLLDDIHTNLHRALSPGLTRHLAKALKEPADPPSDRVQELAQRTWIAFWQALRDGKYDPAKASLSTYLYAISHTMRLRLAREEGRQSRHDSTSDLDQSAEPSPEPADLLELAAHIDRVRSLLSGQHGDLSPEERAALRGIGEEQTDRELARRLGISPSTAHARKKTALQRLADLLSRPIGEPRRAPPGAETNNP